MYLKSLVESVHSESLSLVALDSADVALSSCQTLFLSSIGGVRGVGAVRAVFGAVHVDPFVDVLRHGVARFRSSAV